jgi:hypothetical protein
MGKEVGQCIFSVTVKSLMFRTRVRTPEPILRCSFCNKAQTEVRKLIAGPTAFQAARCHICDECIQLCNDIIRADSESSPAAVVLGTAPATEESAEQPAAPPSESSSTYLVQVVTCKLCGMQLPTEDALVISERGFLCPRCSGEVEAALAQKREPWRRI